jgi:hypothetical protein
MSFFYETIQALGIGGSKNNSLDYNFWEYYTTSFYEFMSTLSLNQLIALTNLFYCIFILFILINIITIVYSEFLINHFKLAKKYPFISGFIRLRQQFQQYYLAWSFSLIIIVTLFVTYFNAWVVFQG